MTLSSSSVAAREETVTDTQVSFLFTGFEPFDGADTNPTQDLVRLLDSKHRGVWSTQVLPTAYRRSAESVTDSLRRLRPRWVLMTGLNASARHLRYEQVALNSNHASKPDNDGELRLNRRIRESGPVGYWNGLPFETMSAVAQDFGETLELSRDAGGFVCNHVFFTVMDLITSELPTTKAGFVHVPPLDEERLQRVASIMESWADAFAK